MENIEAGAFAQMNGGLEASVSRLREGDAGGLEALYQTLRKPVFLLCYSTLGDYSLAEDAAQETFLRVHDKAATYRPGSNPRAWVMSVARSVALNLREKRLRETPAELTENDVPRAPGAEESAVLAADFTRALSHLDEQERMVVILRVSCDLKHADIARVLGIKPGDARVRYFRALKKLRAYYRETDKSKTL